MVLSGGDKPDGYMRRLKTKRVDRGMFGVSSWICTLPTLLYVLSIILSNSISILVASFFVVVCFDCGSQKKTKAKQKKHEKTDQHQHRHRRDVLRHRRAVASSLGDDGRGRKRGDIAGFHVAGASSR